MNDSTNTTFNEIEESIKQDESSASAQDTETTSVSDELDVEEALRPSSDPKQSAAEVAEAKKAKWTRSINDGTKTLDDLKGTASDNWMALEVAQRLGLADVKDEIRQTIKQEQVEQQFASDMVDVKALPVDVRKEIVSLSKEYMEVGATPEKALRKAMEKSKGLMTEMESTRKTRIEAGQLPTGKAASGKNVYTAEQVGNMSRADASKIFAQEKAGEIVIKLK